MNTFSRYLANSWRETSQILFPGKQLVKLLALIVAGTCDALIVNIAFLSVSSFSMAFLSAMIAAFRLASNAMV